MMILSLVITCTAFVATPTQAQAQYRTCCKVVIKDGQRYHDPNQCERPTNCPSGQTCCIADVKNDNCRQNDGFEATACGGSTAPVPSVLFCKVRGVPQTIEVTEGGFADLEGFLAAYKTSNLAANQGYSIRPWWGRTITFTPADEAARDGFALKSDRIGFTTQTTEGFVNRITGKKASDQPYVLNLTGRVEPRGDEFKNIRPFTCQSTVNVKVIKPLACEGKTICEPYYPDRPLTHGAYFKCSMGAAPANLLTVTDPNLTKKTAYYWIRVYGQYDLIGRDGQVTRPSRLLVNTYGVFPNFGRRETVPARFRLPAWGKLSNVSYHVTTRYCVRTQQRTYNASSRRYSAWRYSDACSQWGTVPGVNL